MAAPASRPLVGPSRAAGGVSVLRVTIPHGNGVGPAWWPALVGDVAGELVDVDELHGSHEVVGE